MGSYWLRESATSETSSKEIEFTAWPAAGRDPANAQTVSIIATAQRAVREALREHKMAGNAIAVWDNGRVLLVPPEEIEA